MERLSGMRPVAIPRPFVEDEFDRYVADNACDPEQAQRPQVGVVGIPFDASTMARRGSKYGPDAIRSALYTSLTYNPSLDVDLDGIEWVDVGNVDVPQTIVDAAWDRAERFLEPFFQQQLFYVILGGDHGITYPAVRALAKVRGGPGGIVMVDAHYDVRRSHHGEQTSGVMFRRFVEEMPEISGEHIVEIGINGWHNARVYRDWVKQHGIHVIPAAEIHEGGVRAAVTRALDWLADVRWIYLSLDIDGVDATFAPGTNANHNMGGLTSWQALQLAYLVGRNDRVVGVDVTEVSPAFDQSGVTAELGANLILNCVAGHLGNALE